MNTSRTQKSINNIIFASASYVVSIVLAFTVRTVFIRHLGNNYLGINGLFSNVLSLLSFAELGFGTAIIYALYKPISIDDHRQISALLNFYSVVYRSVGFFILFVSLCLTPFLDKIIGDTSQIPKDLPPLQVIFLMYSFNSALGYFFNYKRSLITASQNGKVDSINQLIFSIIKYFLQIFLIIQYKSFVLYLSIQIFCTLSENISISIVADRMFPFIREYKKERLTKDTIRGILKNVYAMLCHKIGSVIVSGTDNILITMYVGLNATGVYSNYILITTTTTNFIQHLITPITSSVGNLIATESPDKSYYLFKKVLFANSYIAISCSACLIILSNSVIKILWEEKSLLPFTTVIILMLNFYMNCTRKTCQIFIDTTGLFWQIRWKSICEGVLNLVFSLYYIKARNMGIAGVILGTITSNTLTNIWWEPFVVYRYYFKRPLMDYFFEYIKYFLVFAASVSISYVITKRFDDTVIMISVKLFITVIIVNILLYILNFRTDNFTYFFNMAKRIRYKTLFNNKEIQ